jgi:hypothetical protein
VNTVAAPEAQTTQVIVPNRFIRASSKHTEQFYNQSQIVAGQVVDNIRVAANGYLRSILVTVTAVTAGNAATVAFREDGPFNALQTITHSDINGANLLGAMTGWDLSQVLRFGGYRNENRPQLLNGYTATTGAGATGGSFSFQVRVPVAVSERDGFGSLPNMNAASALKVGFTMNSLAAIYSTAPTNAPAFTVTMAIETWLIPEDADANGVPNTLAPPALGAYQRWLKNVFPVVGGYNRFEMPNVSNWLRTMIIVYRDNSGTPVRSDAEMPLQWRLEVDGYTLEVITDAQLRNRMVEDYGYTEAISASGTGIQTGVRVWQWMDELDGKPGFETRELYKTTNSATRFELAGEFSGDGGSLTVLWNDIVIPSHVDRTGVFGG